MGEEERERRLDEQEPGRDGAKKEKEVGREGLRALHGRIVSQKGKGAEPAPPLVLRFAPRYAQIMSRKSSMSRLERSLSSPRVSSWRTRSREIAILRATSWWVR